MLNQWYRSICLNDELDKVPTAIEFFENELQEARNEAKIKGSLEQASARLPGIFEYRYAQLQEIEAILRHLNICLDKEKSKVIRNYVENYNREMSVREAEKYAEGDDQVVAWSSLVNNFALIRNQFSGLLKGLDHKNWQISNIVKLRAAGLDDAQIEDL